MAYQSPSNEELYSDSSNDSGQPSQEPKEDQGEKVATLPKSLCPGMNPGDKIELTIEKVQEDSYLVSYENGGKENEREEQGSSPEPPAQSSGMQSMIE